MKEGFRPRIPVTAGQFKYTNPELFILFAQGEEKRDEGFLVFY